MQVGRMNFQPDWPLLVNLCIESGTLCKSHRSYADLPTHPHSAGVTRILQPSPAHPHNKPDFGSLRARGLLLRVTHVNVRLSAQKSPTIRFLPRFLLQANACGRLGWNVKVNIEC